MVQPPSHADPPYGLTQVAIYAIYEGHMGIKKTAPLNDFAEKPGCCEWNTPGTWNKGWLTFAGVIVYQSWLWGVQSIVKQLPGTALNADGVAIAGEAATPRCFYNPAYPYDDDGTTTARWFPTNNYYSFYQQSCTWNENKGRFYSHSFIGPFVLLLGCFNFFKFSRGLVFKITWHRIIGRIHNVLVIAGSIGAILLASITATPRFITAAFYLLVAIWLPSCLLGWYWIRQTPPNIRQHRRWMTRCFACTCGAITLRLYNLLGLGGTPYWIMVWLTMCHLPVVEFYLQYTEDCDRVYLAGLLGCAGTNAKGGLAGADGDQPRARAASDHL